MPLSTKQRQTIDLLLLGHTQRKAAEMVGTSEGTVSRWMTRSLEFAGELSRRRAARRAGALAMVDAAVPRVLQVAGEVALDERHAGPTRLRAARLVLEVAGVIGQPFVSVEVSDASKISAATDDELRRELRRVLDGSAPRVLGAS